MLTAADQLIEKVIYRTTYKDLYLFKKTLLETGQLVMAATVPVKLEERNATSQDSLVSETAKYPAKLENGARRHRFRSEAAHLFETCIEQGQQFYLNSFNIKYIYYPINSTIFYAILL